MLSMRGIVPELADVAHRQMHCQRIGKCINRSRSRDATQLGQPLPGQAQDQSIELRGRQ
jgi:hypothetical protein